MINDHLITSTLKQPPLPINIVTHFSKTFAACAHSNIRIPQCAVQRKYLCWYSYMGTANNHATFAIIKSIYYNAFHNVAHAHVRQFVNSAHKHLIFYAAAQWIAELRSFFIYSHFYFWLCIIWKFKIGRTSWPIIWNVLHAKDCSFWKEIYKSILWITDFHLVDSVNISSP